jgi:hypothetical protein
MINERKAHLKERGKPMGEPTEPRKGFIVHLAIDDDGYLTDEPKLTDGTVVTISGASPEPPEGGSLIGYRVRLRSKNDDPVVPEGAGDPKGCRLSGGVWYC